MQIFLQIIKYIHKYDLSLSYNCVKLEGGIVCVWLDHATDEVGE
jgi:hypothetical protein